MRVQESLTDLDKDYMRYQWKDQRNICSDGTYEAAHTQLDLVVMETVRKNCPKETLRKSPYCGANNKIHAVDLAYKNCRMIHDSMVKGQSAATRTRIGLAA